MKLIVAAAVTACVFYGAQPALAHSVVDLSGPGVTYNCDAENSVGPNGWRHISIGCYAPLQAQDKMFRTRVFLTRSDGTFETRYGEWRDCNGGVSTPDAWIDANWAHSHGDVVVAPDTKVGGC